MFEDKASCQVDGFESIGQRLRFLIPDPGAVGPSFLSFQDHQEHVVVPIVFFEVHRTTMIVPVKT